MASAPGSGRSSPVTDRVSDPERLRCLLRAKDRMDAASHEEWPVRRLARVTLSRFINGQTLRTAGSIRRLNYRLDG